MALGIEVGLVQATYCARLEPSSPRQKRGGAPSHLPNFRLISIVAKGSAGEFVLDGDPAPSPKRGRSPLPNFKGCGCSQVENFEIGPVI